MQTKSENGTKWISCDNLGELITEFKKFRDSKSANERKSYKFGGGIGGDIMSMLSFKIVKHSDGSSRVTEIINSAKIYQENGTDLSLNLASLNFREADWEPYHQKIKKILKEIWETGEVKDYQGLNLNWPANSQPNKDQLLAFCDQCHKYIGDRKLAYFSDVEKNLDFCSENCHSKFKINNKENQELKKQLKKETNQKNIWMTISILMVIIFIFTFLFCWLKIKKLKKH